MPIEGTHCVFDFSRSPAREAFAQSVVEYVDRKIPELFGALAGLFRMIGFGSDSPPSAEANTSRRTM